MPAIAVLVLVGGWAAACAPQRPLVVPVTPPSEREQNPGADQPSGAGRPQDASGRPCSSDEDCFRSALQRMEEGDRLAAQTLLRFLREPFPESRWTKRAGFLLGKWASEDGAPEADELLLQAATNLPEIEEYSLFFLGNGQREGGRWREAIQTYDRLIQKYPDSVLVPEAVYRRAEAFSRWGDCLTAMAEFEQFASRFPKEDHAPQALLAAADCAMRLQDAARAVRELQQVWYAYPDHAEAQQAQVAIEQIETAGVFIPEPAPEARFQRGKILFDAARYEEAASELKTLLALPDLSNREEAQLKLCETLIQLKRYDEARSSLEDLAARTSRPDYWTTAVFWLGRLAVRQDDEQRLVQIERQLAGRSPASPERARLLFFIGNYYEDRQRRDPAVRVYQQIISELPSDPSAEEAVWRLGWIAYREKRYGDAIQIFEDFLRQRPATALIGQFGYWIGRSAERMGLTDQAVQAYQQVCQQVRRSFYCQQAQVRLAQRAGQASDEGRSSALKNGTPASPDAVLDPAPSALATLPAAEPNGGLIRDRHYALAQELLAMMLKTEAERELSLLTERYATDKATVLKLAELLQSAGDDYQSLRLVRLYFQDVIEKGGEEIPKSFWEKAYPTTVVERIQQQSPGVSIDPYLVAAVIREESWFDPKAVSRAGALGLMQLMPYTAEWVAQQIGLRDFRRELLLDQAVNIHLGSWYLGHLLSRFNGNLVLAVASYNAGPDAVSRWAEGGLGDLDEFIESIPYSETRYYTKKVLRSYNEYRRIAGDRSVPRLS